MTEIQRTMLNAYFVDKGDDLPENPTAVELLSYMRSRYEIDKVLQVRPCASEVGGRGIRYTVRIGQSETHLFDEQNGRWFVEAKTVAMPD